jgi:hypothetical protein
MANLKAGDVLSYSAGKTQTGPGGFRKLRAQGNLLLAAGQRWPHLIEGLEGRTPLIVNAYPATLGAYPFAISVDSYLSARVASRALQLGHVEDLPVILAGQPLFVADVLARHVDASFPLPRTLLLAVGGYPLPLSLEKALAEALESRCERVFTVQFYGVAEVDAACLLGADRSAAREIVYHTRGPEVEVALDGESLLLSLRSPEGEILVDRFATGDQARPEGDGWVIWNEKRVSPTVWAELEAWTPEDWRRRSGYVRSTRAGGGDGLIIQLREGIEADQPNELEFHEFAGRFGFSWLEKPDWS